MEKLNENQIRNLFHAYIAFSLLYIGMSLGNLDLKDWTLDSKLIGVPLLSAFIGFSFSIIWEGFWEWKLKAPFSWLDIKIGTALACVGGVCGKWLPGPNWLLILLFLGVVALLIREYKLRKKLL
jgi:hypothetical protein